MILGQTRFLTKEGAMEEKGLRDRVLEVLGNVLRRRPEDAPVGDCPGKLLDASAQTLLSDFGFDSLDVMQMHIDVEDEFGIEIMDAELEHIQTIGDLMEVISSKRV